MRVSVTRCAALTTMLCALSVARADCPPEWVEGFNRPGTDSDINDMLVFDDGSGSGPAIFLCGGFQAVGGVAARSVAKWDGATVSPLGSGLNTLVYSLATFDDGGGPALYAGGASPSPDDRLRKWNGKAWVSIGANPSFSVNAMAVYDDGSGPALYVAGAFNAIGGISANRIAKWDGKTWSALGDGLDGEVFALTVHTGGASPVLVVGGSFTMAGQTNAQNIARWNGQTWSSIGSMGGTVRALCAAPPALGGGVFAGGSFTSAGGVIAHAIARWNGATWSALPPGMPTGIVYDLVVGDLGTGPALYASGSFIMGIGGDIARSVARWNGTQWLALGTGIGSPWAFALTVFEGALYVGGNFPTAGGAVAANFARWDGTQWSHALDGDGCDSIVNDMILFDDGTGTALYATGAFKQAGTVAANAIAKWDGHQWTALATGLTHTDTSVIVTGNALAVFDDGTGSALYVSGNFNRAGGLPALLVAKWNGTAWSAVPLAPNSGIFSITDMVAHDDGSGPALYATGNFGTMGGVTLNHIGRWNGTNWSALGSGLLSPALTVCVFDDGTGPSLFIGGQFALVNGSANSRVAKWNGSQWLALGNGLNDADRSLAAFRDSIGNPVLVAGGDFTFTAGTNFNKIAQWNGTAWSTLGTGVNGGPTPRVRALTTHDDGSGRALYAAGSFTSAGGVNVQQIARWNGTDWSSPGTGLIRVTGGFYAASCLFSITPGQFAHPGLFAGGDFDLAGGNPSSRLARWGCPEASCIGDVNNNQAVDADDMIAVIMTWGPCQTPCPPACPVDIDNSCTVDVDDLIAVILNWGACE